MLFNECLLLENPTTFSDQIFEEEDSICILLNQSIQQVENSDDLNLKNAHFLKSYPSKGLLKSSKATNNKLESKSKNDDLLFSDDFETFFNKFADIKEKNEINPEKEEPCSPIFTSNLDIKKKLTYTSIDDDYMVKIENNEKYQNTKRISKDKIFKVIKDKSKSKKRKNNIQNNKSKLIIVQNRINSYKKTHRNIFKIQINRNKKKDKSFFSKYGKGIILNSNPKDESLSPGIGNPSTYSHSNGSFSPSKKKNEPPNDSDGEKNKKKGRKNKNFGNNEEDFKEEKKIEEISNYNEPVNNIGNNFSFKFKTKKYFVAENGKKKRVKKKRKFKPDDIRKKIKARFHKTFKNIINENLKKAGSKELFDFLPQCFIGNVSKKTNSKCFELTYKELLSTNFLIELKKENYKNSKVDQNKLKKNIEVLEYLEKNPDICKRSGFDLIKDTKYKDILNIYFTSAQFENSLFQLKAEKESPEYIQEYINKAKTYVSFYSNSTGNDDKSGNSKNNEEEEESEEEEDFQEQ